MNSQEYREELRQQRRARGPLHHFPIMPDSERLSYEFLTIENCEILPTLFAEDTSVFVDKRFKNRETAKEYASEIMDSVYDAKHGGCDFLIKLKESNTYIGILHLFDYSLETFSDVPQRCTIGFMISSAFRRQYFATEAVSHLFAYANENHQKEKFLAYTALENEPANAFLRSLGMVLSNEDYYYGGQGTNYYVLKLPNYTKTT